MGVQNMDEAVQEKTLFQSFVFWIGFIMAVGSIGSLGESLFRGLLFFNGIIDGWQLIWAPAIEWLNLNFFSKFKIELPQWKFDAVIAISIFIRMLNRALMPLYGIGQLLSGVLTIALSLFILLVFAFDERDREHGLTSILDPSIYTIVILSLTFAALLISKFFLRSDTANLVSKATLPLLFLVGLMALLELNAHADENLPYIERWLQAWDDAVTEQLERPMNGE